jgi:uncharacterized protein GlcG (DUF336 family)
MFSLLLLSLAIMLLCNLEQGVDAFSCTPGIARTASAKNLYSLRAGSARTASSDHPPRTGDSANLYSLLRAGSSSHVSSSSLSTSLFLSSAEKNEGTSSASSSLLTVSRPFLSLATAERISNNALAEARRLNLKPIAVVVVDIYGELIVSKREDGCAGTLYHEIALAKAKTCTSLLMSSRAVRDKYEKKGNQVTSFVGIAGGNMAAFPGGTLCRDASTGQVIGAVGVSGAAGDEDEHCGITALMEIDGLLAEPQLSSLPESQIK